MVIEARHRTSSSNALQSPAPFLQVLISSHFLQIEEAVEASTQYIARSFIEVVAHTTMDITSLDASLLGRLARILPESVLEKLNDTELPGISANRWGQSHACGCASPGSAEK